MEKAVVGGENGPHKISHREGNHGRKDNSVNNAYAGPVREVKNFIPGRKAKNVGVTVADKVKKSYPAYTQKPLTTPCPRPENVVGGVSTRRETRQHSHIPKRKTNRG